MADDPGSEAGALDRRPPKVPSTTPPASLEVGTTLPMFGCTLSARELVVRSRQWRSLIRRGSRELTRGPDELRVRFPRTEEIQGALSRLVSLERSCCSHLEWAVFDRDSGLVLTIRGGRGTISRISDALEER